MKKLIMTALIALSLSTTSATAGTASLLAGAGIGIPVIGFGMFAGMLGDENGGLIAAGGTAILAVGALGGLGLLYAAGGSGSALLVLLDEEKRPIEGINISHFSDAELSIVEEAIEYGESDEDILELVALIQSDK